MDDIPQELPPKPEHLGPDDFDADELALRDELDDRLRTAIARYTEAPFGSLDCLTSRLREVNLKFQLSQLDWRVCSRKYRGIDENDATYSRIVKHYCLEQGIFITERERLGRELWHLYRKSTERMSDAEAGRELKPQNLIHLTELFVLLMREITPEEEVIFLADMENEYGLAEAINEVWCPVTGWAQKSDLSAAYIFPAQVGRETMGIIFGDGFDGNINAAENGLFLPPAVKYAFENYQVAIIPDQIGARPREYKFVVLDPTLFCQMVNEEMSFNELHGRKLIFKPGTVFRPNPRYIHFHFAVAMRLALRSRGPAKEIPHWLLSELGGVWKDPTTIIAEDLLIGFVEVLEAHREIRERKMAAEQASGNTTEVSRN
ncbi:hypothetical protein EMCG_05325 [[Emmonsia] crescens]|uniref:HNH nuclease domain-containing protein n=1 Tax=[Emmonsia] crescens TaxID=73230 RepID=A0A0G2HPC9_9EURO|nr:hypothetical protein EMCG_05325 [Emmonsia crescens UAMH 3008]